MNFNYETLMYFHLATVVPCFFIGTMLLLIKKGTRFHVYAGRVYMILMLITAMITLFMPAQVGPTLFNHFGWLHLFSLLTLEGVPSGYLAIKKGNIKRHKRAMIQLYFGALVIAGGFTFVPGRFLYNLFLN